MQPLWIDLEWQEAITEEKKVEHDEILAEFVIWREGKMTFTIDDSRNNQDSMSTASSQ